MKNFWSFPYTSSSSCTTQRAGSQVTDQGWNPRHLQWKHGRLTTGRPGKSHDDFGMYCQITFQRVIVNLQFYQWIKFCHTAFSSEFLITIWKKNKTRKHSASVTGKTDYYCTGHFYFSIKWLPNPWPLFFWKVNKIMDFCAHCS